MRKRITLCTVLLALVLAAGCSSEGNEQSKGNTENAGAKPNLTMAPEGGYYVNETEEAPKESPEEPEPTEVPVNLVSVPVVVYGGVESLEYEINVKGYIRIYLVDENVTHLYIPAIIDGVSVSDIEIFHAGVKEVVLDESMQRDVLVKFTECLELERLYLADEVYYSWLTNCPNAVSYVKEGSVAEQSKIEEKEWNPDVKWGYYGEVPEWVESVKNQSGTEVLKEEWRYVEAVEAITYKDVVLSEESMIEAEDYENYLEMGLQEFSMKIGEGEGYTYFADVSLWRFGATPGDYLTVYSDNRYEMMQADFGHYYAAEILDYDTSNVLKIIVSYPQALSVEKKAEFIDTVSASIQKNLEK